MWTTREYKKNFYGTVFVIEWLILWSNRSRHSPNAAFFVAEENWLGGFFQIILLFIFPHPGFSSPHLSGRFLSWARYYKHTQNHKLQSARLLMKLYHNFLLRNRLGYKHGLKKLFLINFLAIFCYGNLAFFVVLTCHFQLSSAID